MKILFVMEDSIPLDNGCPVRNRYLMETLTKEGVDVLGLTSPFMEVLPGAVTKGWEMINGIRYYRSQYMNSLNSISFPPLRWAKRVPMFLHYCRVLETICRQEKPDLLHAITSYFNGNAANRVGRHLDIPRLYEVRSIAGSAAAVVDGRPHTAFKYQTVWRFDRKAMLDATRVAPLSHVLERELIRRGIPGEKMDVVHNAVDVDSFAPRERSSEIADKYNLGGRTVIGFIGSLRKIEGLSLLVDAAPEILRRCPGVVFLIIGAGAESENLKEQARQEGVATSFIFAGRIPHDEIQHYYSVIDIFVIPRTDALVNQTVAPLKPLEAMATGKAILASDVGGLAEAIEPGETGVLFRAEDVADLTRKCIELVTNRQWRLAIGKAAREWIIKNRQWKNMTDVYMRIYNRMLTRREVVGGSPGTESVSNKR